MIPFEVKKTARLPGGRYEAGCKVTTANHLRCSLSPNEMPRNIRPRSPMSGSSDPVLGSAAGEGAGSGAAAGEGVGAAGVMTATRMG